MYVLIGDIGNTVTKICLIETTSFKVKKIVYFSSSKILLKNFQGKIVPVNYKISWAEKHSAGYQKTPS